MGTLLAISVYKRKLLECIRDVAVPIDAHNITMTASVGVAQWDGTSFDKLVSEADDALYRAKAQGRNRVELKLRGLPSGGGTPV